MEVVMNTKVVGSLQHALNEVKEHYNDLLWWKGRFRHRVIGDLYYECLVPNDGVYIANEDWGVLIILDAAGYNLFRSQVGEFGVDPEHVQARVSRGSATPQFLAENFPDEYPDTVYITGNPMVDVHVGGKFHDLVSVWKTHWDEEEKTVHPKDVRDIAIDTAARYPDKRVIVHFMQPHWPFIGQTLTDEVIGFGATRARADEKYEDEVDGEEKNLWDLVERGEIDSDRAQEAFAGNLQLALPHALAVAREVTGRAVVTADHGNAIGEWAWPFPVRIYGHPPGVRIPSLVRVPWLPFESDKRRKINAGETKTHEYNDETATERLEVLGYVE